MTDHDQGADARSFRRFAAALLIALAACALSPFVRAQTIPALPELAAGPAAGDLFVLVDIDDMPPAAGKTKRITTANLFAYTGAFAGNAATVTVADAASDPTTFPLLGTAGTGSLAPATDPELSYNANTDTLTAGSVSATVFTGTLAGSATTAGSLAADPTDCSAGQAPRGIDADGNAVNCTAYLASAGATTDNAIARYDGVASALQNSAVTVADVTGSSVTVATTAGNALAVAATAPAAANGASQAGVAASLTASPAVASLDTAGAAAGGSVTITAGAAARNTSGNANGGNINLVGGAGIGTGTVGQVYVLAGTAAVPSLSSAADPNSGINFLGSDVVQFVANGAARAQVDGSGLTALGRLYGNSSTTPYGFVYVIEAVTTTKTPDAIQAWEIYTNTGDTDGAAITMPDNPTVGICYKVSVTVAQTLTVTANTGETLYMGADQCVASMTASGIGASMQICSVVGGSGGQWHSFGASGWTCND